MGDGGDREGRGFGGKESVRADGRDGGDKCAWPTNGAVAGWVGSGVRGGGWARVEWVRNKAVRCGGVGLGGAGWNEAMRCGVAVLGGVG